MVRIAVASASTLSKLRAVYGPLKFSFYASPVGEKIRKFLWDMGEHKKYGCYIHDVANETHPVVAEAVRRLPGDVQEERNKRMERATMLSMNNELLPREQWTKYEEDPWYLTDYILDVELEARNNKNPFIQTGFQHDRTEDEHLEGGRYKAGIPLS